MLDRMLAFTLLTGLSGALQASFSRVLPAAAQVGAATPRGYLVLVARGLSLLAVGAVIALAAAPRTRWPGLALTGALVGLLGSGLACLSVGADARRLLPATLTTAAGALLYRLLLPAPAAPAEEEGYV